VIKMKNNKSKWSFIKPTLSKVIIFLLLLIFFNPGTVHYGVGSVEYYNCPPEDCNPTKIYWEYNLPWNLEGGSGNRLIKEIFPFFIPIFYIGSCLIVNITEKVKRRVSKKNEK